ncbi:MAG: HD domain-containing protein [Planctomycetes bacterium]|nr:HD domain-containing protein [Planctomycetota bacterium]
MVLTHRFPLGLEYACRVHSEQVRKGTSVPYVSHLLSVCGLVMEYGGDEDESIAALLHDAVEDGGGQPRLEEIRNLFGDRVAQIVWECSDTDVTPKPPWKERKETYIARLSDVSSSARLVSCCDKLHNARCIVADLRLISNSTASVWEKFKGGREGTLWYYTTIATRYDRLNVIRPLVEELHRTVEIMQELSTICSIDQNSNVKLQTHIN